MKSSNFQTITSFILLLTLMGCSTFQNRGSHAKQLTATAEQLANVQTPSSEKFIDTHSEGCPFFQNTASERCTIHSAKSIQNGFYLAGDILTSDGLQKHSMLKVDSSGKIEAIGCFSPNPSETVINCTDHIIAPGMINPHDHLGYNQNFPGGQKLVEKIENPNYTLCNLPQNAYSNPDCANYRYDRRNEWRKGLEGKPSIKTNFIRDPELKKMVKAWNELRHVIAGVTTIAGSGGQKGLARNPDRDYLLEGLQTTDNKVVNYNTFPLGDIKDVTGHYGDCHYPNIVTPEALENRIFLPHVSEGINKYAVNEYWCLTGKGMGSKELQAPNSTFIHGIAVSPASAAIAKKSDMTFVWSPRSNISLYGNTASVTLFKNLGVRTALSTDWSPSGSMNMPRELACAQEFNQQYLNSTFSDKELWEMVTINAARALGFEDQIGKLSANYWADLMIFKPDESLENEFKQAINVNPDNIALVLRGGSPLYGEQQLLAAMDNHCEQLSEGFHLSEKSVCVVETGFNLSELSNKNNDYYPLYFANNTPSDEPTCVPARYQEYQGLITTDDKDGDNIGNDKDNCPNIFNPVRPMDNGKQADYDGDGIGDACDKHPMQDDGR